MDIPETRLVTPNEFPFPYVPYGIQRDFMRNLYEAIEGKKLAVFESPTGTGKSMSLICGSLKWLFDAQKRLKNDVVANIRILDKEVVRSTSSENWLEESMLAAESMEKRHSLRCLLKKIDSLESRIKETKEKSLKMKEKGTSSNKPKPLALDFPSTSGGRAKELEGEEYLDFLLDKYSLEGNSSDDENSSSSEAETEEEEKYFGLKVFLCSRTHSQLSQLLGEIQKSPYKDLQVRVVSLASRQNYCVNESVLRLKHLPLITDKCQELRNKGNEKVTKTSAIGEPLKRQKATGGCPFYRKRNIENVKTKILTEIGDVEDLVSWGKYLNGCPYYASRLAIDEAQVVLVPYNTILHKSTRQAYGINIKNSVVIIDEAHNLLDAIGNIHSCRVTGLQLIQTYQLLVQYRDKYHDNFSALSLLRLNQLIFILTKLLKKVGAKSKDLDPNVIPQTKLGVLIETLADFMLACEIDTVNIHKLLEFINGNKLVNKLQGFINKPGSIVTDRKMKQRGTLAFIESLQAKKEAKPKDEKVDETGDVSGNTILSVISFIEILTNHCLDGRIISNVTGTVGASSLKYILLNPASHFSDIVSEARSVILAGGTMQPVSEFTDQLFRLAGGTPDRISVFTCGHVISEDNILPIIVTQGPSKRIFDFSYRQRSSLHVQDELGRLLSNLCKVVPAGIVCFFPSYEYESLVYERFQQTKVIEKVLERKKVFREPRKSSSVDEVLKAYAKAAREKGAVLFSVVGGKLSEGLNFSDELGRCIMVVGLPFPNINSVELKEKMNYLNKEVSPTAGDAYYESFCMKAVNQSIGRAVRHKNDYASVLLIDHRYGRPKCMKALPEWIQKSLKKEETFGPVLKHLGQFFASKRGTRVQARGHTEPP